MERQAAVEVIRTMTDTRKKRLLNVTSRNQRKQPNFNHSEKEYQYETPPNLSDRYHPDRRLRLPDRLGANSQANC